MIGRLRGLVRWDAIDLSGGKHTGRYSDLARSVSEW